MFVLDRSGGPFFLFLAFAIAESKPKTIFRPICRIEIKRNMKFLTLDYIKQHSRIDFDCEDELLELYGDSAEETLAGLLNRGKTVDEMVESLTEEYGDIPARCYHAALILTEQAYNHRGPVSPTNMSIVPYGFDYLVKPLMKLTTAEEGGA